MPVKVKPPFKDKTGVILKLIDRNLIKNNALFQTKLITYQEFFK
jgi:hypothetical protein